MTSCADSLTVDESFVASARARKPRVAFVVQRCGPEVNGGSEAHCLAIARHMQDEWDIEILTTCAQDYMTWENAYSPGIQPLENFRIRRFAVDQPRDVASFNLLSERVLANPPSVSMELAEEWVHAQGPVSSTFLAYLAQEQDAYEAFFFFTYLYATTALGLPLIHRPLCLIPTAHREKPLELPVYDRIFAGAQHLLLNTEAELGIIQSRFPGMTFNYSFAAVGIEKPERISAEDFRAKYGIHDPFVIYVGRVDESKGCSQLFDYWKRFKSLHPSSYRLVLLGQSVMDIPKESSIVPLGFVSEQDKWNALAAAELLINPSPYESLSMVLLEAWSIQKPTLVTAACEVTVQQSQRSQGGLWYQDFEEFCGMMIYLLNRRLKFDGANFVADNYSWSAIKSKYRRALGLAVEATQPMDWRETLHAGDSIGARPCRGTAGRQGDRSANSQYDPPEF